MISVKVCQTVVNFLNNGTANISFNFTYIVLISKVKHPVKPCDFRPISLCNVLYKLAFKVFANRLKKILPNIISPSQSTFIPRKLISDNVVLAYAAMHTMATRQRGRKGSMALELDMSKAYDKAE